MAFVTYGHHALIAGNRSGAIIGTFLTIVLAILFTYLQYIEYSEASFSFADSVYGSVFFASTGLHGLIIIAPFKFKKFYNPKKNIRDFHTTLPFWNDKIKQILSENLLISPKLTNSLALIKTDPNFIHWLTGFIV